MFVNAAHFRLQINEFIEHHTLTTTLAAELGSVLGINIRG